MKRRFLSLALVLIVALLAFVPAAAQFQILYYEYAESTSTQSFDNPAGALGFPDGSFVALSDSQARKATLSAHMCTVQPGPTFPTSENSQSVWILAKRPSSGGDLKVEFWQYSGGSTITKVKQTVNIYGSIPNDGNFHWKEVAGPTAKWQWVILTKQAGTVNGWQVDAVARRTSYSNAPNDCPYVNTLLFIP